MRIKKSATSVLATSVLSLGLALGISAPAEAGLVCSTSISGRTAKTACKGTPSNSYTQVRTVAICQNVATFSKWSSSGGSSVTCPSFQNLSWATHELR